jgi:tetratricopeptide (TPR) repeat protein
LALTEVILSDSGSNRDDRLAAQAHLLSVWCCTSLGLDGGNEHAASAERIMIDLDDSVGLANLYLNRGISAWNDCRASDAVGDFEASSERYSRAGDVVGAALADNNLAELLTCQYHLERAEDLLVRARRVTEAANYPHGSLATISGLSRIAAWRGDVELALELQSKALSGFQALRADPLVADSLLRLVEIHVIAGDAGAALALSDEASKVLEALGEVPVMPSTLARLRARALQLVGRNEDARAEFVRCRDCAERDGYLYEVALAKIGLGRLDGRQDAIDAGMTMLRELDVLAPPPGT